MTKLKNKSQVKVTIEVRPASPTQKVAWQKFWAKVVAGATNEAAK